MSTLPDVRSLCFTDRSVTHIYYGEPPESSILPLILGSHETSLVVGSDVISRVQSKLVQGFQPVLSLVYDSVYTEDVAPENLLQYLMASLSRSKAVKSEWQCWFMRHEALRTVFGGFLREMEGRRHVMKPLPTGVECVFEAKKGEHLATATFSEVPFPNASTA